MRLEFGGVCVTLGAEPCLKDEGKVIMKEVKINLGEAAQRFNKTSFNRNTSSYWQGIGTRNLEDFESFRKNLNSSIP